MKKIIISAIAVLFTLFMGLSISAQRIDKPDRTPVEPNSEQMAILREGISFHDRQRYDEAIAKYKRVLELNKDCTLAMYELALTYYTTKQLENALSVSLIGSRYKSDQLPLFYLMIANVVDDQGNPVKAIQLYKDGIKIVEGDPALKSQLSSLYFNLGVTYARQELFSEARGALKKSVENDFMYPSPNYLLAYVFYNTKYRIPAVLAAIRLVTLERNTARTNFAAKVIIEILGGNIRTGDTPGTTTIFIDPSAQTDEGDFGSIELFLSLSGAVSARDEASGKKSPEELFADQFEKFVNMLLEKNSKKLENTFVGKTYFPMLAEMKRKGYIRIFAYLVQQQTGSEKAREWLVANKEKANEFLEWAKTYNPDGK